MTESQKESIKKYMKSRDRLEVNMPKGKKAIWQEVARLQGKSLNQLICEQMDKMVDSLIYGEKE